ncbi:hypothetical protein [Albidovulum sp.]|uniref:hypothetical protein n=1 Tax=Albidovulum sp. TaxID=1872424 RepID=UPI0039B89E70
MQQKLFALSLGFGGLILATHHAFAAVSDPRAGLARTVSASPGSARTVSASPVSVSPVSASPVSASAAPAAPAPRETGA